MLAETFVEIVRKFNNKMKIENRNALLFLDNCSAHPGLEISKKNQFFSVKYNIQSSTDGPRVYNVSQYYKNKVNGRHVAALDCGI